MKKVTYICKMCRGITTETSLNIIESNYCSECYREIEEEYNKWEQEENDKEYENSYY